MKSKITSFFHEPIQVVVNKLYNFSIEIQKKIKANQESLTPLQAEPLSQINQNLIAIEQWHSILFPSLDIKNNAIDEENSSLIFEKLTSKSLASSSDIFISSKEEIKNTMEIDHFISKENDNTQNDKIIFNSNKEVKNEIESETKKKFIELIKLYENLSNYIFSNKELWKKFWDALFKITQTSNEKLFSEIHNTYFKDTNIILGFAQFYLKQLSIFLEIQSEVWENESENQEESRLIVKTANYDPQKKYTLSSIILQFPFQMMREANDLLRKKKRIRYLFSFDIKQGIDLPYYKKNLNHKIQSTHEYTYKPDQEIGTQVLGSKEWNSNSSFHFSLKLKDLNICMNEFKDCYYIQLKENRNLSHYVDTYAIENRGDGEKILSEFKDLINTTLDKIEYELLEVFFKGVDTPPIFLYLCSSNLLFYFLMTEFEEKEIGLSFYINRNGVFYNSYPEAFIKNIFILWFNKKFSKVDTSLLDSFYNYSQILQFLRWKYKSIYEDSKNKYFLENKDHNESQYRNWILKNPEIAFGEKSFEIFKHFRIITVTDKDNSS